MSKFGLYAVLPLLVLLTACSKSSAEDKKNAKDKSSVATTTTSASKYTAQQKLSYAMGVEIGIGLRRSSKQNDMYKDLRVNMLAQGLQDSFDGKKLALTQAEMRQVIMVYRNKLIIKRQADLAKLRQEHDKYFEKIKKNKDMIIDKSGLVYKIIKPGKGTHPKPGDTVQIHYSVITTAGKVLFSSKKVGRPVTMVPKRSFLGVFKVALPLMKLGSKWTIHAPAKLAFGTKGRPPQVKPMQAFVFNVELIAINPKAAAKPKTPAKPKTTDKKQDKK